MLVLMIKAPLLMLGVRLAVAMMKAGVTCRVYLVLFGVEVEMEGRNKYLLSHRAGPCHSHAYFLPRSDLLQVQSVYRISSVSSELSSSSITVLRLLGLTMSAAFFSIFEFGIGFIILGSVDRGAGGLHIGEAVAGAPPSSSFFFTGWYELTLALGLVEFLVFPS